MKRIITILVIGLGLVALCAAQEQDNTQFGIFRQEGIASYYGKEFAGRPTASGELFDPSQLTAAHPTLPFGTMLRLTNKHNNKQVIVRVNDRGPFVSARFLDVSQGAAEQLGMISTGTAPVLAESLGQVAMAAPDQAVPTTPVPVAQAPSNSAIPQDTLPVPTYQPPAPAPAAQGNASVQPQAAPQNVPVPVYQPQSASQPQVTSQPQPIPQQAQMAPQPSQQPPTAQIISTQTPPVQQPAAPVPAYQPPAAQIALPPAEILPGMPPLGTNKTYRVQVGSFKVPRHAAEAFEKLKSVGLNPAYERNGEYYRVVLSGIRPEEIQAMAEKLGVAGFREALIREER